jgi:SAM-dependent methyltransferase
MRVVPQRASRRRLPRSFEPRLNGFTGILVWWSQKRRDPEARGHPRLQLREASPRTVVERPLNVARDDGIAFSLDHGRWRLYEEPAKASVAEPSPPRRSFRNWVFCSMSRTSQPSTSTASKFEGGVAERWSDEAYANTARYLDHRAELVCSLGPPLIRGDRVLDLACGDGGLGEFLLPRGLSYVGVDSSGAMVAAGRQRLGAVAEIVHADLNDYEPTARVAATTVFGALYYVRNRPTFFRRVAEFTEKKLVFNLSPRRFRLEEISSELKDAGFDHLDLRPFFVPQTVRLPAALLSLLIAAEQSGWLARGLLRVRFSYICAASRTEG